MKISFNSLAFKTLLLLFISSVMFISFVLLVANYSFSQGYKSLVKEDINSIEESISPSIALNLSYGFNNAIDEIAENQLKNKKILLISINSSTLEKDLIFSNSKKSIDELKKDGQFISRKAIYDPATLAICGEIILVYSNKSYKVYMQNFYIWFGIGIFVFSIMMLALGYILYNSLRHLTTLATAFEEFNPNRPKNFFLNASTKDEISTITKSANKMSKKLVTYITDNKALNLAILQKEAHLKEAQRIASVGSWEYDVINSKLILSDEIYRMLDLKLDTDLKWNDFLNYISKDDYTTVVKVINNSIIDGSNFNIKYALTLKDNNNIHLQTKGKVERKHDGVTKVTAVSMDITNDIKNKKTIEKLAYYDSLTGLANRILLKDRMHKAIQNAKRKDEKLTVMFLDLDHFKLINDTLGHSVGDELLIYISDLLKSNIRESDTLSRIGGDEFIILLPSIKSTEDAILIASKIQKLLQNKHNIGSHELFLTSSIGVALYPDNGDNIDELIRNADTAMYEAKNNGRNSFRLYSPSMGNYIDKQMHLEQDLVHAIKNKDEIEVYYQVKVDAKSNSISGAEALVRWNHPENGIIYPDDFIHVAESTGLMIELGNIVIEKSIAELQEWNNQGFDNLKIAINLSARQFQDSNLPLFISTILDRYKIDPRYIEVEITETISMTNMTNTLRILNELKAIGISIAIDDFGTGHSSLSYLKKFPIDTLKIDKSFIMGIAESSEDKIIAQTIISMSHSLGFKTVAEGIETSLHAEMLQEMGCDELQGYYFSRPIPKDKFTKFLQEYKS